MRSDRSRPHAPFSPQSFKVEGGTDGKDGPISAKFTGGFKAYGLDFKKVSVDSGSRIGVETK